MMNSEIEGGIDSSDDENLICIHPGLEDEEYYQSRLDCYNEEYANNNDNSIVEITKNNFIEGKRDETPKLLLKYCQFISKHLYFSFAFTLFLHVSIMVTTGLLLYKGYAVFPLDFTNLPLVLYNDNTHTQDLAWRYAMDFKNKAKHHSSSTRKHSQNTVETLEVIVEGNDLFSEFNMELLNATESRLFYREDYQKSFCSYNIPNKCEKPVSLLRLFDGTFSHINPGLSARNFTNVQEVVCAATMFRQFHPFILPLLEKNFDPCKLDQKPSKTRFFIFYGWHLNRSYDEDTIVNYLVSKIGNDLQCIRDSLHSHKLSLAYFAYKMFSHDLKVEAFISMKLALGSFVFIFLFMWFQTSSFWITFFGLLSIGTSFLLTNLIYRYILKYDYFGFFHIISIFIILGIGADDVFIFFDTWMLSRHKLYPTKAHRIADCYKTAAKTAFVTSLTTMGAFLVSAFSPLLPVSSFGIFSGMLVGVNYLFDLICFPIVMLVYSSTIQPRVAKIMPCSRTKLSVRTESQENLIISIQETNDAQSGDNTLNNEYFDDKSKVVVFMKSRFYNFITWRPVRILVPLLFIGATAYFAYRITTLEPDTTQVKIFKDSNNYAKAARLHYDGFQQNYEDGYTKIHLSWGLKQRNMDSCDEKSGVFCRGQRAMDNNFDLESPEAQLAFMNLCQRLGNLTDREVSAYRIKRNTITNRPEISCFMPALIKYIQGQTGYRQKPSFPFTKEFVTDFMQKNSHIYNVTRLPVDFDRYFEILISHWLTNGYTYSATEDKRLYSHLIGEEILPGKTIFFNNSGVTGMYGTKLRVAAVEINTTLTFHNLGYPEGKPIYQMWETFINEEVTKMPKSLLGGFQSTTQTWHYIKVQEILVNSAVRGLLIGIALAFPILTITTLNIVIGFLATVCIAMITVVVVGLIPVFGWKLGVIESINLSLVVGLAVDYVVHFAEAYRTAPYSTRGERVKSMLEHMGLSVLSGAITTLGAAVFMLFAQVQFTFQFGIFVVSTIGISFLFSFLFFTAFMTTFGPQGETGSILAFFSGLKMCWKDRKINVYYDDTCTVIDSDIELIS